MSHFVYISFVWFFPKTLSKLPSLVGHCYEYFVYCDVGTEYSRARLQRHSTLCVVLNEYCYNGGV